MDNAAQAFNTLRPRLQGIAYRMLGSVAEAEDVVQDTWLRWHDAAPQHIKNTEAWLVTVATRLAIDRLRATKAQRDHHATIGMPELPMTASPATPEQINERANDVSMAYLILLERLTSDARAAFLLHEVFDTDYCDIALTLNKTQAACRQLVSRARAKLREEKAFFSVPQETHQRLLRAFSQVLEHGDLPGIQALLAEDAVLMGEGSAQLPSLSKTSAGSWQTATLFLAPSDKSH